MDDQGNITDSNLDSENEVYPSNACSVQATNIDQPTNKFDSDDQRQHYNILAVHSSWKKILIKNGYQRDDSGENEPDETGSSNNIQVIFTIPYTVSNEAILNHTVFITDPVNNQLLASFTTICINGSSFIINYSTNIPLPHDVCLYLLLNITLSTALTEIITCRTIENNSSSNNEETSDETTEGPRPIFIVSQGVIIFIMMFIIYLVDRARNKHLVHHVGQHLFRIKPLARTISNRISNDTNDIQLNNLISSSVEEQLVTTNDLTPTFNDRNRTKHTLINIKELKNRLSK